MGRKIFLMLIIVYTSTLETYISFFSFKSRDINYSWQYADSNAIQVKFSIILSSEKRVTFQNLQILQNLKRRYIIQNYCSSKKSIRKLNKIIMDKK